MYVFLGGRGGNILTICVVNAQVIVERYMREKHLPLLDKTKFLVPFELTMGQFLALLRWVHYSGHVTVLVWMFMCQSCSLPAYPTDTSFLASFLCVYACQAVCHAPLVLLLFSCPSQYEFESSLGFYQGCFFLQSGAWLAFLPFL